MPEAEGKKWTTKFINDLPDAAFAIILPGGKKDEEGKTVPRSLRLLPHHGPDVKDPNEDSSVDIPHLRNALARVSQMKTKLTDAQRKKARAHLEAHAKRLLKTRKKAALEKIRAALAPEPVASYGNTFHLLTFTISRGSEEKEYFCEAMIERSVYDADSRPQSERESKAWWFTAPNVEKAIDTLTSLLKENAKQFLQ